MAFYLFISISIIHKVLYFLSPIPNHFNKSHLLFSFYLYQSIQKSLTLFFLSLSINTKVTYSFLFISINQYKSIFQTYHCISHIYSTPQQFSHWLSNFLYLLAIKNNCIQHNTIVPLINHFILYFLIKATYFLTKSHFHFYDCPHA